MRNTAVSRRSTATIADHIAGMTDSYCNSEYRQLVLE